MLYKLSIKNIKKSIKDYGIYFFTLVFAVAMFYCFNSIDAQSSMLVLNSAKYDIIKALVQILSYVSVFVSIVLGFLIVYSNNFLIKRRKKEIGLYEILGMNKRKISLILFFETVIVGLFSLIIGLIIGIFISQFISIFIAKLFEVNLSNLIFIFSKEAFIKTILYFGIIFLLVIVFNVITLNRYKIIDLLTANRKSEQVKIRNKYVIFITFILSILFTGYAYYLLIHERALLTMDSKLIILIISGAIGTFLLFFSLSGFLLKIFEKIKKVYYKGLNIFTLKQVNSKINTSVVSTTVICLMLLLTISLLAGSMSMGSVFNTNFEANNLTDYTVSVLNSNAYVDNDLSIEVKGNDAFGKFDEIIKEEDFKKYSNNYVLFHKYYDKNLQMEGLIDKNTQQELRKKYGETISFNGSIPIIKESEYIEFMELAGKDAIDIKENEYLLLTNLDMTIDAYKKNYEDKVSLVINNYDLLPASNKIIEMGYENYSGPGNEGLIVVSDSVVENLDMLSMSLVGNFNKNDNLEKMEDNFDKYLKEYTGVGYNYKTRTSMSASSIGIKAICIFLGLYLGITFAISSATVLAIGELSNSSDNKKRYKILNQIGTDDKMINKTLFTQIAITFAFPLVIALIHSYFALRELNGILVSFGSIDLTSNILLTTLFMVIIYGGYFVITYLCSKNILKN